MLRPQDSATRERRDLSGLWKFRTDAEGVGRDQRWFAGPLHNAIDMPVPASYNDIVPGREIHDHVGDVWYQTVTRVPRGWQGERVFVRFDSATHRATVWVGDQEVVSHEGGYTPFEAEITEFVTAGQELRITAVVDNILTWDTIPPGIVTETPHGKRQRYMHDFFNYAGLHRPVWLYSTPQNYVADIDVVPTVEGDPTKDGVAGLVDYAVSVEGGSADVRVRVLDAEGAEVVTGEGAKGQVRIEDVRLWQPGEGYQYRLVVELLEGGEVVDEYVQKFGVRTVEITGTQFLINGKPFYFTGFGMHEDQLVRGKGQDDATMVHDFEILKWMGANSFRTSHYPYSEEKLDYADDHGIVVIDETAAVGMNKTVATTLGTPIDRVYGPEFISERTQKNHKNAIAELIARDKNRPSVVMWSINNEPESDNEDAAEYHKPLFELARSADPQGRPVATVNVQFTTPQTDTLVHLSDAVLVNRYYGWYTQSGDLAAARDALEEDITGWEAHGKPILFMEFGADTVAGLHTLNGAMWSEEYQTEMVQMFCEVFDEHEAVQGEHLWNFADFQTSLGIVRVDGNKKGVFTRDRRPKAVAHMLRRRWTGQDRKSNSQD